MSGSSEQTPEVAEKKKPICWASPVTYMGVGAAAVGAVEISRGNYRRGIVWGMVSAGADCVDGWLAKRFTRQHPEAGAERAERGAFEDQAADRLRNSILGFAIAKSKAFSPNVRRVAGTVATVEAGKVLAGGAKIAIDRQNNVQGIPKTPPSSPTGKESMWWVAGGLTTATVGAALRKDNHPQAATVEKVALGALGIGVIRMGQAMYEYIQHMRASSQAEAVGLPEPEPQYGRHIGQVAMDFYRRHESHLGEGLLDRIT